jgi:hypothetical protein
MCHSFENVIISRLHVKDRLLLQVNSDNSSCGLHNGIAEDSSLLGVWRRVSRWVAPDVYKRHSSIIFNFEDTSWELQFKILMDGSVFAYHFRMFLPSCLRLFLFLLLLMYVIYLLIPLFLFHCTNFPYQSSLRFTIRATCPLHVNHADLHKRFFFEVLQIIKCFISCKLQNSILPLSSESYLTFPQIWAQVSFLELYRMLSSCI